MTTFLAFSFIVSVQPRSSFVLPSVKMALQNRPLFSFTIPNHDVCHFMLGFLQWLANWSSCFFSFPPLGHLIGCLQMNLRTFLSSCQSLLKGLLWLPPAHPRISPFPRAGPLGALPFPPPIPGSLHPPLCLPLITFRSEPVFH